MTEYEWHVTLVSGRGAVKPTAATGAGEGGGDGPAKGETCQGRIGGQQLGDRDGCQGRTGWGR